MQRRTFQIGLTAGLWDVAHARRRHPVPPAIDAVSAIKALRIQTGPLTGGYTVAHAGMLNWYFAHLGLLAVVPYLSSSELEFYIRPHLELHLARLEPNFTIQDVLFDDSTMQSITPVLSDSDNSYAATLLSLVARYLQASGNWAWWEAHRATLSSVAQANIVGLMKANGLCRVFQLLRISSVSEYGFTMNNAEDYRGLRDWASVLSLRGQTAEAEVFAQAAHRIGLAVDSVLWDADSGGYRVSDQDRRASPNSFYPGSCCQVFAQAFGIIESSSHHAAAYAWLNTHAPNWPAEVYDPFPWCILGYVAALRGDKVRAQTQLASTEALYQSRPERVTIHELGYYLRTRAVLQGQPA